MPPPTLYAGGRARDEPITFENFSKKVPIILNNSHYLTLNSLLFTTINDEYLNKIANWLTLHYTYKRKRTYRQHLSDLCGLKSLLLVAIFVSKRDDVLIPLF